MGRNLPIHVSVNGEWVPLGEVYVSTRMIETIKRLDGETAILAIVMPSAKVEETEVK